MTERKSTLQKALLKLLDVLCLEAIALCLLECGVLLVYRNYEISFSTRILVPLLRNGSRLSISLRRSP